jgi:HSP20 family protein
MANELSTRSGRDLWAFPTFGRAFDEWFGSHFAGAQNRAIRPALDVEEDAESLTIRAELAGIKKDDVNVTIEDGILTITGEKRSDRNTKEKNYHLVERSFGSFQRALTLPTGVDSGNAKASFEDGVLTVVVPKSEAAKPKTLEID